MISAPPNIARVELPTIVDQEGWLGYFAGWEGRSSDYAFGNEGKGALIPKMGRKKDGKKISFGFQERVAEKKDAFLTFNFK